MFICASCFAAERRVSAKAAADLGLKDAAAATGLEKADSTGSSMPADPAAWQAEVSFAVEKVQQDVADVHKRMSGLVRVPTHSWSL